MDTTRREVGMLMAGAIVSNGTGGSAMASSPQVPSGAAPSILPYLADLDLAVAELKHTWKPDDPRYLADIYRQVMMNLSYSYFACFHADAEHPDWAPLWNPVYLQQPNPDTIYLYAPLRGDLTYRVAGNRGNCHSLVFSTQEGFTGFVGEYSDMKDVHTFDTKDLSIESGSAFEIIFSEKRPTGYQGHWAPITRDTDTMMVRYIAQDWVNEIDPKLTIECLDLVAPKKRLSPDEIMARIARMARFPVNMNRLFYPQQDDLKKRLGTNVFELQHLRGVEFQYYWPAAFEFSEHEALIVETELPKSWSYWNLQLNDPYFNCIEYVYRLSSINGATGMPSSDGKIRAVVALEDPGVPNWLDTAGFTEGTLWGRWFDCDSTPLPTIKRVPLGKVREFLPADTPTVEPEQRAIELRDRVRAAQNRRRW